MALTDVLYGAKSGHLVLLLSLRPGLTSLTTSPIGEHCWSDLGQRLHAVATEIVIPS